MGFGGVWRRKGGRAQSWNMYLRRAWEGAVRFGIRLVESEISV